MDRAALDLNTFIILNKFFLFSIFVFSQTIFWESLQRRPRVSLCFSSTTKRYTIRVHHTHLCTFNFFFNLLFDLYFIYVFFHIYCTTHMLHIYTKRLNTFNFSSFSSSLICSTACLSHFRRHTHDLRGNESELNCGLHFVELMRCVSVDGAVCLACANEHRAGGHSSWCHSSHCYLSRCQQPPHPSEW